MFGRETTACGRALIFVNFLISFACLIALSTIIIYLTFNTNKNNQSSGDYVIDYKPMDLSPGVYVYQLQTKNKLLTGKMIKSQ